MHNDEGFREIQLNGKQLVFLFMAATVVSVVIVPVGVLVRPRCHAAAPNRRAAARRSRGCRRRAAFRGAHPPRRPAEMKGESKPEAAATGELSYPDRLLRDTQAEEKLKTAPPAAAESPAPARSADRSGARGSAAARTSSGPSAAGSRTCGGGSIKCRSSRARPIRPRLCGAGQHLGDASRGRSTGASTGRQGLSCIRRRSRQRHAKADLPDPRRQIPEQERG